MRSRTLLVILALALVPASVLLRANAEQPATTTDHQFRTVSLILTYTEGVEKHYTMIPWSNEMTVLDAMKHAAAMPAPMGLTLDVTGGGETAFVRAIDGLRNEGGGRGARNWTYRVNDEPARASAGVVTLKPNDTVRWTFAGAPAGE